MKVGASLPYGNTVVMSTTFFIASSLPLGLSLWFSSPRTAALNAQHALPQVVQQFERQFVHLRLRDFQSRLVVG